MQQIPYWLAAARESPSALTILLERALAVCCNGCVAAPESPHAPAALQLAAEASAALFAAIDATETSPVSVPLGKGESVSYTCRPEASLPDVGRWIDGYFYNALRGDLAGVDRLCRVNPASLRVPSVHSPDYDYHYAAALYEFRTGADRVIDFAMEAMRATLSQNQTVFDNDWASFLIAPQLEVFIYAATGDERFNQALLRALDSHARYWKMKNPRAHNGYVSLRLTALARIGTDCGLSVQSESPYLPRMLGG